MLRKHYVMAFSMCEYLSVFGLCAIENVRLRKITLKSFITPYLSVKQKREIFLMLTNQRINKTFRYKSFILDY